MKQVPLSQNKFAIVDDADYDFLMQWKWCLNNRGYAVRSELVYKPCGKKSCKTILMHRTINKTPEKNDTDHINGDKLDNRRKNLRSCTHHENTKNVSMRTKNKSSIYKGVYLYKKNNKWMARIMVEKKSKYLGYFDSEALAAKAYNEAAIIHYKEYAKLNNI